MKQKALATLLIAVGVFFISCKETNKVDSTKSDYYSTRIDTTYNRTDRTKIDEIRRYIYEKGSSDLKKSLTFSKNLMDNKTFKYSILKVDRSDINNYQSGELFFHNVQEIKTLFYKIDSLSIDETLKEREKRMYYEISKQKEDLNIMQYSNSLGTVFELFLTYPEYEGIKSTFEKYLLEN